MRGKVLLALVAALSAASAYSSPRAPQGGEDVVRAVRYYYSHMFGSVSLELDGRGRYVRTTGDCTSAHTEKGSYEIADGVLSLTCEEAKTRPHGDREGAVPGPESARQRGCERTSQRLLLVGWGERMYLIDEAEARRFANAVNVGAEPRRQPRDLLADSRFTNLGLFLLREGDEEKPAPGLPEMPAAWQPYLLKQPVSARVAGIRAEGKDRRVALLETRDGEALRPGMLLSAAGHTPLYAASSWLEVVSVEQGVVRARVHGEVKLGDVVSTRYEPADDK